MLLILDVWSLICLVIVAISPLNSVNIWLIVLVISPLTYANSLFVLVTVCSLNSANCWTALVAISALSSANSFLIPALFCLILESMVCVMDSYVSADFDLSSWSGSSSEVQVGSVDFGMSFFFFSSLSPLFEPFAIHWCPAGK
ncbi:hypothetical protein FKM82_007476 [Ascaphus truei]